MRNNDVTPGASTSSNDPVPFSEHHPTQSDAISRRRLLTRGAVAGGLLWVAPTIDSFSAAHAQGTFPDPIATSPVYKHSVAGNPLVSTVCISGATASATRGDALFTRILAQNTISLTVTIVNGPNDLATRQIVLLQSTESSCLTQIDVVGSIEVPIPPPPLTEWPVWGAGGTGTRTFDDYPILPGATHFSMALLQSGGGGTDTYTTARVPLAAP